MRMEWQWEQYDNNTCEASSTCAHHWQYQLSQGIEPVQQVGHSHFIPKAVPPPHPKFICPIEFLNSYQKVDIAYCPNRLPHSL